MRRTIVRIAVFLIAGAIVNVAVAWGCAGFIDVWRLRAESSDWAYWDPGDGWEWIVQKREVPGARIIASSWLEYDVSKRQKGTDGKLAPREETFFVAQEPHPHEVLRPFERRSINPKINQVFSSRGFPLASMWCEIDVQGRAQPTLGFRDGALIIARSAHPLTPQGSLPLRPIWPGFIINTLFYAVLLGMLCITPGKVRLMTRRWRNRCPACAYPIGTSPVCTESGHPLR